MMKRIGIIILVWTFWLIIMVPDKTSPIILLFSVFAIVAGLILLLANEVQ